MLTTLVWLLSLSDESNLLMIFLHFHLLSEPTTISGCLGKIRTSSWHLQRVLNCQLFDEAIKLNGAPGEARTRETPWLKWRDLQDLNLNLYRVLLKLRSRQVLYQLSYWRIYLHFSKNNINFFQLTSFIIPQFLQFGKPKSHLTTRNQTSFEVQCFC